LPFGLAAAIAGKVKEIGNDLPSGGSRHDGRNTDVNHARHEPRMMESTAKSRPEFVVHETKSAPDGSSDGT